MKLKINEEDSDISKSHLSQIHIKSKSNFGPANPGIWFLKMRNLFHEFHSTNFRILTWYMYEYYCIFVLFVFYFWFLYQSSLCSHFHLKFDNTQYLIVIS